MSLALRHGLLVGLLSLTTAVPTAQSDESARRADEKVQRAEGTARLPNGDETLDGLIARKKKEGWAVVSQPVMPKELQGTLVKPGVLSKFAAGEKVRLRFTWVVVRAFEIGEQQKKEVVFKFNSGEMTDSHLRLEALAAQEFSLGLSKNRCKEADGTTIKFSVETRKGQEKVEVSLQKAVLVYDTKGVLRQAAFLGSYSTAALERTKK